jgi:hypothetical protein
MKPLLCPATSACLASCSGIGGIQRSYIPHSICDGAVGSTIAAPSTVWISEVTYLVELLP